MPDDLDYSGPAAPPPAAADVPTRPVGPSGGAAGPTGAPVVPRRKSSPTGPITWVLAAVVVLILAAAGGLLTAWIVANMNAVPGPVAFASPSPGSAASFAVGSPSPAPGETATPGPRRTPTAQPTALETLPPFVYVVQPGDHLVNIADLFQVDVQDIIDLNEIKNPNKLFVGQELLIPGYGVQPTPKPSKTPRH